MRKRKLAAAAAAALGVFSAGWVPEVLGAQVDQDVFVSDGKDGCTVKDILEIPVKATTWIHFKMQSAGYEFDPNDGIKFVKKTGLDPIPGKEFEKVKTGSTPTEWIVKDKNSHKGHFGYEVHVRRANAGPACTTLDPTVFNDGNCTEGCPPAPLPKDKK